MIIRLYCIQGAKCFLFGTCCSLFVVLDLVQWFRNRITVRISWPQIIQKGCNVGHFDLAIKKRMKWASSIAVRALAYCAEEHGSAPLGLSFSLISSSRISVCY